MLGREHHHHHQKPSSVSYSFLAECFRLHQETIHDGRLWFKHSFQGESRQPLAFVELLPMITRVPNRLRAGPNWSHIRNGCPWSNSRRRLVVRSSLDGSDAAKTGAYQLITSTLVTVQVPRSQGPPSLEAAARSTTPVARTTVKAPSTEPKHGRGFYRDTLAPWIQHGRERLVAHTRTTAMLAVALLLFAVVLVRKIMERRHLALLQKRRALGLESSSSPRQGSQMVNDDPTKANGTSLPQRIAEFYDTQSELWEQVWGEHMHHGFYGLDGSKADKDHHQAQIDMMDQLLLFSSVDTLLRSAVGIGNRRVRVLDVGCGIGGASRHIATRYGANVHVTGVTLSPVQASRAQVLSRQMRLEDRVETMVANALQLPFPDNTFDVVWSMESAEHMPDKLRFMQECARVLRPGGRLAMTAWCHRACPPPFNDVDRRIYQKVCEHYCIPYLCALNEFENYAWQSGLTGLQTSDWTKATMPFWPAVARSAFQRRALLGLVEGGWPLIRAALAVRWMIQGFRRGLFVIGALSAEKPISSKDAGRLSEP